MLLDFEDGLAIHAEDLNALPSAELSDRFVSWWSLWNDQIWYFPPSVAGGTLGALDWNVAGRRSASLLDPEWASLLDMSRRFVWALAMSERERGQKLPLTMRGVLLRPLLAWMMLKGIKTFAELTPAVAMDYAHTIARGKWAAQPDDLKIAASSLASYLSVLVTIYNFGFEFRRTPAAVMTSHPFGGRPTLHIAKVLEREYGAPRRDRGFIPPVPDEIFAPVIEHAMVWVERYADDVIAALAVYMDTVAALPMPPRRRLPGAGGSTSG